jgi:hypothetical protein
MKMAIDFKTFLKCVFHVVENRNPILIRGRHGIGKSELVGQIANQLGLKLVMRRGSQMTEGDLLGLPSIECNRTQWNPPDWFKTACEEPVLLFLDEIDRSVHEVEQGFFELTDSRQLAGHRLHEGTVIMAAINGGDSGAQYDVNQMDPAALDRYTIFDLEPSVEDWLSWAGKNCHELVVEFIRENSTFLEHSGDFEPNKIYPSRRSWKRLSDCLSRGLFDELFDNPTDTATLRTISILSTGYVGLEAAVAFEDFLREGVQITAEDLLAGKLTSEKIKKIALNQHNALIDRFEQKQLFEKKLTEKEIEHIALYLAEIPAELSMRFFNILGSSATKSTVAGENLQALSSCAVNGEAIGLLIVKIITGEFGEKSDDSKAEK